MPSHDCPLPGLWEAASSTPFFLQGLLEERNNQIFFGEVGRQMVTGLMTRAEKVGAATVVSDCLAHSLSLQNLISGGGRVG